MDFVEVAAVEDLAEGTMISVDVGGNRVLVAMVEEKPYAMRAICTHERSFLDEGWLMDYEVMCPLHFSCFDLRTGEATSPPAEDPEPLYEAKIEDGKVLVSSEPVEAVAEEAGEPEPAYVAASSPESSEHAASEEASGPAHAAASSEGASKTAPSSSFSLGSFGVQLTWPEDVMEELESLPWLREATDRLTEVTSSLRSRKDVLSVLDVLHGRWFGHAIHPPISDLPIGFWTGAFLLDLAKKREAAGLLSAAGIAGGMAAFVTGAADWSVTDGRTRRLGLLHGLLNTAGLALQGVSLISRARGRHNQTLLSSGLSLALTYSSGYIGGYLVTERWAMVDHAPKAAAGPRKWTQAVKDQDLHEGQPLSVPIEGRDVLLYKTDGVVSAIENACSHAGAPLSLGSVENDVVTCPWHQSQFNLVNGRVIRGPAQHSQPMLESRSNEGWIEVRRRH